MLFRSVPAGVRVVPARMQPANAPYGVTFLLVSSSASEKVCVSAPSYRIRRKKCLIIVIVPHHVDQLEPRGRIIMKLEGQHPDFEPGQL